MEGNEDREMFKDHYSETVVVVLAIVMGIIMAIAAIIIDGSDFNFGNIFKIWAMVTLVILLVSIFVPYKAWSEALLRKLRITENSFWYKVLDGIIPTLVLNTVITVFVSAANILFNESIPEDIRTMHWIQGMLHGWPITFVVSYFASYIAELIGKAVASHNCEIPVNKDPKTCM